jgi:hypothetical protein
MKNLFSILLVASLCALTGCARHYAIRLNNGTQVVTSSKPKLEKGFYVYKDARGQLSYIPAGRVSEIGPASQMSQSPTTFNAQPAR